MRKFPYFLMILVTVFTLAASACAPQVVAPAAATQPAAQSASAFKVAGIFPGVITDADYNTLAYLALTTLKADLGCQTAYKENVLPADVDKVMREYVSQKYNVIWTHGGQFVSQTVALAKEFPDMTFIAEGDAPVQDPPANLWFITRNFHTGFYAVGVTAALSSKTGKVGYISGQTLPFTYAEVHAIQQGLKDQNLTVELKTVWTGDFNDPAKAREAANAMIADGVDVIIGSLNLGMVGVFEAVKTAKTPVLVTAKYSDKTGYAPKNYITALLYDFSGPLKDILQKVQKGEKGGVYPLGFATGVSLQSPLQNVPTTLQPKIDKIMQNIKDSKIQVVNDVTAIK
jgi:basic membrane protein A and related proteins